MAVNLIGCTDIIKHVFDNGVSRAGRPARRQILSVA
jgi:hypothetical protein